MVRVFDCEWCAAGIEHECKPRGESKVESAEDAALKASAAKAWAKVAPSLPRDTSVHEAFLMGHMMNGLEADRAAIAAEAYRRALDDADAAAAAQGFAPGMWPRTLFRELRAKLESGTD